MTLPQRVTRARVLTAAAVLAVLVAATVTALAWPGHPATRRFGSGGSGIGAAPVPGLAQRAYLVDDHRRVLAFWSRTQRRTARPDSRPWVVYVHGGGWVHGAVDEPTAVAFCRRMVSLGITCFSLDYTLAPQARWPEQGDQVASELAWVRAHGPDFDLDPRLGFAVGHSAGGLMAGVAGLQDGHLAGIVSLAGATNVPYIGAHNHDRNVARFARLLVRDTALTGAYARSASVIDHVDATTPRVPYLLVHERDDPAVNVGASILLARQLRERGFPVTLDVLPGDSHQVNVSGPGVAAVDSWLLQRIRTVRAKPARV